MTTQAQAGNDLRHFPKKSPAKGADPVMATGFAFFLHEVRRNAPPLGFAFLLMVALPIVSRLIEGEWRFWDGSRNALATALALYVIAPVLTVTLAASGWARERSLHLLDWLYARPLSARAIFAYRALAIAIPISIWAALAMTFGRVRWPELELVLASQPWLPGPLALLIVGIGLALGAGLLTSALAPTMEWAVRWSAVLVILVWLAAMGLPRVVATATVLRWTDFSSPFLAAVVTGFVAVTGLIFLGFAWRALSQAPDGPGRVRRVAPAGAAAVVATLVVTAAVLHLPRLAEQESGAARWMGEDTALSFGPARGIGRHGESPQLSLSHPVVRTGGHATVLRDVYAVRYRSSTFDGPWIEASRGLAMLPAGFHDLDDWVLFDRNGDTSAIQMPPLSELHAIGWSPSGARFAWKCHPVEQGSISKARVVVIEDGGTPRGIEIGVVTGNTLQATWIDDRTLLLTDEEPRTSDAWWTTLDVENGVLGKRQELKGSRLTAPALIGWVGPANQSRLPVLDGVPVAIQASPELESLWPLPSEHSATLSLVRIDSRSGILLPGTELPARSLWTSFGSLDDGSLIWAAPERMPSLPRWDGGDSTQIYRLSAIGDEPEAVCSMPTGRLFGFLGESGPWLVWDTDRLAWPIGGRREARYELWGCNRETKEARVLTEWSEWAHPLAAISDRGLFTAAGWVPLEG